MGEIQWTREQRQVIDLRNRNILVSAAAGSGKTAVLVERIIAMIMDEAHPVDIDRLLVVTFTNAAAAQMKERIGAALEKKIAEDPENVHLQKQLTLLNSAMITTIHSFCLDVIRNHFNEIDLEPGFRVAQESELTLLKSDVLGELLEEWYEEEREDFKKLTDCYSTARSDMGIENMILNLHHFSLSYPWPQEWLEENRNIFGMSKKEQVLKSPWMKALMQYLNVQIMDLLQMNEEALAVCREDGGPYMYEPALLADGLFLDRLNCCTSYPEYAECFQGHSGWDRLSSKRDGTVLADKKETVKLIRDDIKKTLSGMLKDFFFRDFDGMCEDLAKLSEPMAALIDITEELHLRYRQAKAERNLVDFNDLEHFALDVLIKHDGENQITPAAQEYRERFEEILIDEYQDSNFVQDIILHAISREMAGTPNEFMVGDVKQSIYKFRLARPELFMDKYSSYSADDSLYQRIDLHHNFRSRKDAVLEPVNFMFRQIMTKELGGIIYDDANALYQGGSFPETDLIHSENMELILVNAGEEESEEAEESSAREREARAIAARIRELTDPETGMRILDGDTGEYRPAVPGDIVILLRTMSGWSDIFSETLTAEGIGAFADTQTGYFSASEVQTALALLKVIDNPRQDIPLAAVLRSFIGGFSAEELARIRSLGGMQKDFYEALLSYGKSGKDLLAEKALGFLETLENLRCQAAYLSVYDLLVLALEKTGYQRYVLALPGGEKRKENLNMLLSQAVDFENTGYRGLFSFNRYMEKIQKYEIDYGEANLTGENPDTVRIMSIHKSKGLEFPIVFLAGISKKFNQSDAAGSLVIHPDLGLGPDYVDPEKRLKVPTLAKRIMQKKIVLDNLGEELRVLYVAMTRAKEKLILTGAAEVPALEAKLKKWAFLRGRNQVQISFHSLTGCSSYLDYILAALMRHKSMDTLFELCGMPADGGYLPEAEQCPVVVRFMECGELAGQEAGEWVRQQMKKEELLNFDSDRVYDSRLRKEIETYFSWQYRFEREAKLPVKLSVSELKKAGMFTDEEESLILFPPKKENQMDRNPQEPGGAALGTVYHKIMECLDFERTDTADQIRGQIEELVKAGKLNPEDLADVKIDRLEHFFGTSLGKRMRFAASPEIGGLYREQPFVIGIPAEAVYPEVESTEEILIQGIIDAFFREEDELVLVDYKTDRVYERESLVKRYHIQLDYYAQAISRLTGKKVKEKWIYSFTLGEEILLD
ncbi:helicase-exonuclease AddAB subunit AddA [Anaerolentibacter hominis]|uniref:helicase-exonuclease AddAB subunit AddA n=1 Tax=Anaerolentibacter hominis TaxID=3079009 RepID=UPI0031B84AD3